MRKKLVLLLAATMATCGSVGLLSACGKDESPFNPGDTLLEEREGEFTYGPDGELIYSKYNEKKYDVKYIVGESSYVELSGQKPTELVLTGYKGDVKEISVKDIEDNLKIDKVPVSVVGVADGAFRGCETLESVDLTKSNMSLTFSVGSYAFANCVALKSVVIPEYVFTASIEIGSSAFSKDISLTTVTLGNKVSTLGAQAFYNCSALSNVTIPQNVTTIKYNTFANCDSLASINVAAGAKLKSIQDYAFQYSGLSTLNLSNLSELRYIGNSAFENTKLSSVSLPDSVTYIGDSAFYDCQNLSSINVPFLGNSIANSASFESIYGVSAIEDIRSLNVTVKSARSIPANSFSGLENITSLTINSFAKAGAYNVYGPDGVDFDRYNLVEATGGSSNGIAINRTVGDRAFYNCSGLTSLILPSDTEGLGAQALSGCKVLNSFTIPASVKTIGEYAFQNCKGFNSFTVPASVTSVGTGVFAGCNNLSKLTVAKLNGIVEKYNDYGIKTGYVYNNLSTISTWFDENNYLTEVTVDSLYTLPANSLNGFLSLRKVSLTFKDIDETLLSDDNRFTTPGVSVTPAIGSSAFNGCVSLTDLTVKDDDGIVESIGNSAFYHCRSLKSFTVPETVTSIGSSAFNQCYALESFTIPASVNSVGDSVFTECDSLKSLTVEAFSKVVTVKNGTESQDMWKSLNSPTAWFGSASYVPEKLATVTLKGVSELPYEAFKNWVDVQTLNIEFNKVLYVGSGRDVTPHFATIGGYAFAGLENLTTLNITGGENVKEIGQSAFKNCEIFTSAHLAKFSNVAVINSYAFDGCVGLTDVTLPGTITSIANNVFFNCPNITVLNIGNYDTLGKSAVSSLFGASSLFVVNDDFDKVQKYVSVNGDFVPLALETITVSGLESLSSLGTNFFNGMTQLKVVALDYEVEDDYLIVKQSDLRPFSGCTSLEEVFLPDDIENVYLMTNAAALATYGFGAAGVYKQADTLSAYGNYWHLGQDGKTPVIYTKYEGEITYTLNIGDHGSWVLDGEATDPVLTQTVELKDEALTLSDIPEYEAEDGYVLVGWYENSSFIGKPVSFPYYSNINTNLYAKWVEKLVVTNIGNFDNVGTYSDTNGKLRSSGDSTLTITSWKKSTVTLKVNLTSAYSCGTLTVRKNSNTLFTIENNSSYYDDTELGVNSYKYTTAVKTLTVDLDEGDKLEVVFEEYYSYNSNGNAVVEYSVGNRVVNKVSKPVIPTTSVPSIDISKIVSEKGYSVTDNTFSSAIEKFKNFGTRNGYSGLTAYITSANGFEATEAYDYSSGNVKQTIKYNNEELLRYYKYLNFSSYRAYFTLTDAQIDEIAALMPEFKSFYESLKGKWLTEELSGSLYPSLDSDNILSVNKNDYNYDNETGVYWKVINLFDGKQTLVAVTFDSNGKLQSLYLTLLRYNEVYLSLKHDKIGSTTVTLPAELEDAVDLDDPSNFFGSEFED